MVNDRWTGYQRVVRPARRQMSSEWLLPGERRGYLREMLARHSSANLAGANVLHVRSGLFMPTSTLIRCVQRPPFSSDDYGHGLFRSIGWLSIRVHPIPRFNTGAVTNQQCVASGLIYGQHIGRLVSDHVRCHATSSRISSPAFPSRKINGARRQSSRHLNCWPLGFAHSQFLRGPLWLTVLPICL